MMIKDICAQEFNSNEAITLDTVREKADLVASIPLTDVQIRNKLMYVTDVQIRNKLRYEQGKVLRNDEDPDFVPNKEVSDGEDSMMDEITNECNEGRVVY